MGIVSSSGLSVRALCWTKPSSGAASVAWSSTLSIGTSEEDATGSGFSRKLKADLFLDDRSFGGLPDWGTIYHRIQAGKALDGEWHRLGLYEEEEEKRGFFSRLFSRD